jgi:pantetheine-phosphate adenylyltransferase
MKAIYPGSFDPFTLGHLNILERALKLFDHIAIVVADNSTKKYMFTPEQRFEIVRASIAHLNEPITVIHYPGIVADFINEHSIDAIIRGIRGSTDVDYEIKLEQYNRMACRAETVYLTTGTEYLNTSSTLVKMFLQTNKIELASEFMREEALEYIQFILSNKGRS